MKRCYGTIENGAMVMPAEVLDILPQGVKLYIRTDSETGSVTILAKDPSDRPNKQFFDFLDKEAETQDWETYSQPAPPELIRRPGKPIIGDES